MELDLFGSLIVCFMVFLSGLIGAVAGGGGLVSVPAYLFAGIPIHYALGTDRLASLSGGIVSSFRFYRHGFVDIPLLIPSIIATVVGSIVGAWIALLVSEYIMQKLLLVVIPLVGFYVFRNKKLESGNEPLPRRRAVVMSVLTSLVIGCYNGFYGPGSGIFLLLAYNKLLNMDIRTASGNSKIVGVISTLASLVVFIIYGKVLFLLGFVAALFNLAGGYIGAGLVLKKGAAVIRPSLLIMLLLIFIKLAAE